MAQKRMAHGDGSIYQRQDGRWVATLMLPTRKRKYLYAKTKGEALKRLREAQRLQMQGLLATGPRKRVQEYIEDWLDVHRLAIKRSTYTSYQAHIRANISPLLGKIQLQKLTTAHIQEFVSSLLKNNLKPGTVRLIYTILNKAMKDAVRWGFISINPCSQVTLPRKDEPTIHCLSQEEAYKLVQAIHGHRLECLIILALTTGMRRGELLGLKWEDIDFDAQRLYVRRTVAYVPRVGYIEQEPKTVNSKRGIMLSSIALEALKKHRKQQLEKRLQSPAWKERDLVFSTGKGGYVCFSDLQEAFKKLLLKKGLPTMRFHDLRHSAATLLLAMGVHPKVVQELLGHSSIKITMDRYSHIFPSMQRDAMQSMDQFLREAY